MSTYLFAKEAALEDLAEMIDAGAGTADVLGVIQETLDQPIAKYASEEDVEARLGIEAVCYDFLKTASEYYAVMDVNDESEAMVDCFIKVAAKEEGKVKRVKDFLRRNKGKIGIGAAALTGLTAAGLTAAGAKGMGPGKNLKGYLARRKMSKASPELGGIDVGIPSNSPKQS